MISSKNDAIQYIAKSKGNTQFNKDELQASLEVLQNISSNEGLPEKDIEILVEFLTTTKLASSVSGNLFNCLIPETMISSKSLEEILLWFFCELGNEKISGALAKKFLQWLTGIVYYELADTSVVESYYHSFLFLLNRSQMESSICRLLCLISKPEDAKRWVVQQVLHIQSVSGPKPHTNALLSLLKSYHSNVVPERIAMSSFNYKATAFDEFLQKAHARKLEKGVQVPNSPDSDGLQWNTWSIFHEKGKRVTSLIPSADLLYLDSSSRQNKKKVQAITEFKTMASLGIRPFDIECPAESLSLLTNIAGYHVLAFSDIVIKTRFSHKLYHTLCKVYLLELEPHSEKEKIHFLNSIKGLQEYTQQGIPVVNTFLFNYLPIWDGEDYREQILGLLEWIEVRDEQDLEKYVFPALRQIFISSGTHCKCLIIETMGKLMRNLLVMYKRERNFFRSDFEEYDVISSVKAISTFVSGLITNGLIWNNEKSTRSILMTALDFYETCQGVEQAGDLPLIMIMPPALVYSCLFSCSRLCIARICSLLVRLQVNSVERLYLLGVYQDFATQVQQLNVYMMDYYRCLWHNINFREDQDSFIFHDIFRQKLWKLKERYADVMDKIFGIEYNASFWDPKAKGIREIVLTQLAEDYPAIGRLKQITEERLLQAF